MVLAIDFHRMFFVVRASRPHDSTAIDDVRPGRPHHKSSTSVRERQRRDIWLAWGVSPRAMGRPPHTSPGGATEFHQGCEPLERWLLARSLWFERNVICITLGPSLWIDTAFERL